MSSSFVKFYQLVEDIAKGVHQFHAAGHTLKAYLSNGVPNVATQAVKGDLAEITNEHGYAPVDIENDVSRSNGTLSLTAVDKVITANGGTVGPFRYVVIYNDSVSSPLKPLIGYADYGSAITLQDGETFTIDFGSSVIDIT